MARCIPRGRQLALGPEPGYVGSIVIVPSTPPRTLGLRPIITRNFGFPLPSEQVIALSGKDDLSVTLLPVTGANKLPRSCAIDRSECAPRLRLECLALVGDLDPVRRAPGTIAGIAALRNNANKPELAGVCVLELHTTDRDCRGPRARGGCRDLLVYCDSGRCHHDAVPKFGSLLPAPLCPERISRSLGSQIVQPSFFNVRLNSSTTLCFERKDAPVISI
jgi:hypothetical protein